MAKRNTNSLSAANKNRASESSFSLFHSIDTTQLQLVFDTLHLEIDSLFLGIADETNKIRIASGFTEICARFHRNHPLTAENCKQCNQALARQVQKAPYAEMKCLNGLTVMALPVFHRNRFAGVLYSGQCLLEDDDQNALGLFEYQAKKYGFDTTTYLAAAKKIPVCTRAKLRSVAHFLENEVLPLLR